MDGDFLLCGFAGAVTDQVKAIPCPSLGSGASYMKAAGWEPEEKAPLRSGGSAQTPEDVGSTLGAPFSFTGAFGQPEPRFQAQPRCLPPSPKSGAHFRSQGDAGPASELAAHGAAPALSLFLNARQ